jgi:protein O-GlcNAc transferase
MNRGLAVFNAAVEQHQAGRWQEAERLYRQVLAAEPSHAGAINNYGLLLMQAGELDAAEHHYWQAIERQPNIADYFNNLGTVLVRRGRFSEALAAFDRALELRPDFAEAQNGRGNVFLEQQQHALAVACYQRALSLNPNLANAHCNLGNAFKALGALELAADAFRQALRGDGAHAVASFGLGHALLLQGRADEAAAWFRRTIDLKPEYPEAHLNLAIALHHLGRLDEALVSCEQALMLEPDSAEASSALGSILKGMARLEEAVNAYRQALALRPDFAEAHGALAYGLYFCPGYDAAAIAEEHRKWNERHAAALAGSVRSHENEPGQERRLRIGYVSAEYRDHCQSFFTVPLLGHHDGERLEVYCYSNTGRTDQVTQRLRSLVQQWRDISRLTAAEAAEVIQNDRIDILVDFTMHMAGGRPLLFARKPAPVQVCWLAYPGTTGLTAMDYRITDPFLDPPGMFDQFYAEESIRLPHTFWCYDPLAEGPDVNRLPAVEKGYVTFGCLNNFCKVNEGVLRLWAGVMRAVERSRLMLLAPEGSARERVLTVLGEEGIEVERVTFVAFQPRADYLATYRQIDIGLETLPYNGQTTSLDSFWMGVPVPTIVGQTVVGRAGVCLLENLGLPELIAQTPEDYVRVVSKLAGDWERLAELRTGLRKRMERSPLMDGKQFARDMEAAYRMMWRKWCERQAATQV